MCGNRSDVLLRIPHIQNYEHIFSLPNPHEHLHKVWEQEQVSGGDHMQFQHFPVSTVKKICITYKTVKRGWGVRSTQAQVFLGCPCLNKRRMVCSLEWEALFFLYRRKSFFLEINYSFSRQSPCFCIDINWFSSFSRPLTVYFISWRPTSFFLTYVWQGGL